MNYLDEVLGWFASHPPAIIAAIIIGLILIVHFFGLVKETFFEGDIAANPDALYQETVIAFSHLRIKSQDPLTRRIVLGHPIAYVPRSKFMSYRGRVIYTKYVVIQISPNPDSTSHLTLSGPVSFFEALWSKNRLRQEELLALLAPLIKK